MRAIFHEMIESRDLKELLRLGIKAMKYRIKTRRRERKQRPLCEAKTRKGTLCQAKVYWPQEWDAPAKRCRLHGGLSTGPTTAEGMERLAKSAKKSMERVWKERREGLRPMPKRKAALRPEEEFAGLTLEEIAALGEATMEVLKERINRGIDRL